MMNDTPGKGLKGGNCNRSSCQRPAEEDPDGIRWFNQITKKYYCRNCAWRLNHDPFNRPIEKDINLCVLESE